MSNKEKSKKTYRFSWYIAFDQKNISILFRLSSFNNVLDKLRGKEASSFEFLFSKAIPISSCLIVAHIAMLRFILAMRFNWAKADAFFILFYFFLFIQRCALSFILSKILNIGIRHKDSMLWISSNLWDKNCTCAIIFVRCLLECHNFFLTI